MKSRILVVDDEPSVRDALRQVLEYEGMDIRTAGSGGEGLTLFEEFRPHVVVLDVKMAGLDGLDS
ncbi:MAG: response regulator [Gemmatimonadetes bacterium]|nr:response regulator [Gemmatimonadota bacterium]